MGLPQHRTRAGAPGPGKARAKGGPVRARQSPEEAGLGHPSFAGLLSSFYPPEGDHQNQVLPFPTNSHGSLKQIDAGAATYISGVNPSNAAFCLSNPTTAGRTWHLIEGAMKYYTCGPLGCWGVNSTDDIHFRLGVTPSFCQGTGWQQVAGKLSMIEVGTDGSVYGVTREGEVYRRDGITDRNLVGTKWTQLHYKCYKFSHVSYDLSQVWLITTDGKTFQCEV